MEVHISFILAPEAVTGEFPATTRPEGLPQIVHDRAAQYADARQRLLSIWGYALLRDAIGVSGIGSMDSLRFAAGGKPYLVSGPFFSIAHSGNMVICAVCSDAEIGVDIEQISAVCSDDLRAYFSGGEWQVVAADGSNISMFRLWVRKEAILKAAGEGINDALYMLDVREPEVLHKQQRWFLCDLAMPVGYVGCIAATKAVTQVHMEDKSTLLRLNR